MSFVFGDLSLAIGALLLSIFIGWIWGAKFAASEIEMGSSYFKKFLKLWIFMMRYIIPISIFIILLNLFGIFNWFSATFTLISKFIVLTGAIISMDDQVRSKLIYEEHPNYEKPPLVPLPEEQDVKQLKDLNLTSNVLIQTLVRFVLKISGFLKFYRQLKNNPEHYLKHTDMRSRALFPVVSATLALEDDPQKRL